MRKPSRTGGEPVKARRRKSVTLKRRKAPKVTRSRPSFVGGKDKKIALLTRERDEALEQHTATSEVLKVISSCPGQLGPVFDAILANAVRICEARFGNLALFDGKAMRVAALYNAPYEFAQMHRRDPTIPLELSVLGPLVRTKKLVHVRDLSVEEPYANSPMAKVAGARTAMAVPMLKENELIGAIAIYHRQVRPFTDKQIALLTNFAAQAVIAIENARLLNELRQRTADLTQALEQQTATSEVLKAISSSRSELDPVFRTMLANATHLCEASFGILNLYENGLFPVVATYNAPPDFVEMRKRHPMVAPGPNHPLGRVAATKQVLHISDVRTEVGYQERDASYVAMVEMLGGRTIIVVPMLNESELVGTITIFRQEVHPFSDRQIALVSTFADQAVIAIENARLLKELRERTTQLEVQSQEVVKFNQQLEQRVADQVGEIERMGRLRRFLPPQVADLIVASGTEKQLESHRREITALFCDLRGFTGFSEASAPEDVMTLLRDYHAAIGDIIIKYSGTLERYAGDGVMVVFNDPVPVDNPALRAVQMALETRDAMGALTEKWRELGHDVGFGIGIAHGYATLGTIGFEGRFDYAAIGTVSNVASRLCDEAKPGQILISPRVFMAVKDAVTVESVGEFTLKGIGRPLAAYNVLAAASLNA